MRTLPRLAYFDVDGEVRHGYVGFCDGVEISDEEARSRCAAKRIRELSSSPAVPEAPHAADPRVSELMGFLQTLADEVGRLSERVSRAEADGQIARALWEEMRAGK